MRGPRLLGRAALLLAAAVAVACTPQSSGQPAPHGRPAAAPAAADPLATRAAALDAAIDDPGVRVSVAEGRMVVSLAEASIFLRGEPVLLQEGGEATLAAVAKSVAGLGGAVQVIGHTDDTGTAAYALDLSERQAQAVAEALRAGGVPASRLRSWGLGDTDPVAPNDSPRNRSLNRRVVVSAAPTG